MVIVLKYTKHYFCRLALFSIKHDYTLAAPPKTLSQQHASNSELGLDADIHIYGVSKTIMVGELYEIIILSYCIAHAVLDSVGGRYACPLQHKLACSSLM